MSVAPLQAMPFADIQAYVDQLEEQNRALTKKLDNRKKLCISDARRIRRMYKSEKFSYEDLSEIFAVNPVTIYRIITNVYYAED